MPKPARTLRTFLAAGLAAAALAAFVAAAWAAWQRLRDPLAAIDREAGRIVVVRDTSWADSTRAGEARRFRELALDTEGIGTVRLTTSRPAGAEGPLPLAFVLAGFRTGRESLREVPAHGPNLLVGYEYPYTRERWRERGGPLEAPAVRKAILDVPAQVSVAVERLREEGTVEPGRTSLLGFSFGALFAPAAARLAAVRGIPFAATVLAYGGADIGLLVRESLDLRPAVLRRAVGWAAATAVAPMEPASHLPHLPGETLIIRGSEDERIPERSADLLEELAPEPKTVVGLDEAGHMGPDAPELTARIVGICQEWLGERGLAEPPPRGHIRGEAALPSPPSHERPER